jgi:hypothetical protein
MLQGSLRAIMRTLKHDTRVSLSPHDLQVSCFVVLEAKRGHAEHAPARVGHVEVNHRRVAAQILLAAVVEHGLDEAELAVAAHVQLGLLVEQPRRPSTTAGARRTEHRSNRVSQPCLSHHRDRPTLPTGHRSRPGRRTPVTAVRPLEALGVEGEGAADTKRVRPSGCTA